MPRSSEAEVIWDQVREDLRSSLPPSAFETWLAPMRPVGLRDGRLYVEGPENVRAWFERRYSQMAGAALRNSDSAATEIVFTEPGGAPGQPEEEGLPAGLQGDHDFDHFIIGPGNRFAHAAALAVAESPGEAYNPLFLYGEPGLGKTHLLISIANYLRRSDPAMTVIYTTAERFTSEFVTAVRRDGAAGQRFKRRYREIGALLIDDIQFLENKPATEDEFFHTFNELYAAGSQIVLSSDRPPEAMERLTQRLRDRFAWGLTVRVEGPDTATRIALLRKLAFRRGLAIPDDETLQRVASSVPGNLRQLEGALTRVCAYASLHGRPLGPEIAAEALGSHSGPGGTRDTAPTAPTLEAIVTAAAEVFRVSEADLVSKRRAPNLVRARQLGMYVARSATSHSLAEIATAFHRDHSTVVHSVRTIERSAEVGNDVHKALEAIYQRLGISR